MTKYATREPTPVNRDPVGTQRRPLPCVVEGVTYCPECKRQGKMQSNSIVLTSRRDDSHGRVLRYRVCPSGHRFVSSRDADPR